MVSTAKWLPLSHETAWHNSDLEVLLTTDVPCHLWCRVTDIEPEWHLEPTFKRGAPTLGDLRSCFVQFTAIEQQEQGDTTQHTFIVPGWIPCLTRWWYFIGTIAGQLSPSDTPDFTQHYLPPPAPAWTLLFQEPWSGEIPDFWRLIYEPWTLTIPEFSKVVHEPWSN